MRRKMLGRSSPVRIPRSRDGSVILPDLHALLPRPNRPTQPGFLGLALGLRSSVRHRVRTRISGERLADCPRPSALLPARSILLTNTRTRLDWLEMSPLPVVPADEHLEHGPGSISSQQAGSPDIRDCCDQANRRYPAPVRTFFPPPEDRRANTQCLRCCPVPWQYCPYLPLAQNETWLAGTIARLDQAFPRWQN